MVLGLNTIVRAHIDRATANEIRQQDPSPDIQDLFVNGMEQDFTAPAYESGASLQSTDICFRFVVATQQQHEELISMANEYFSGNISDAVGWVIKKGLTDPRKSLPTSRSERIVKPRVKAEESEEDLLAPSAQILVQHRQRLGLSQRQLAARIGMSRGLIADIELARRSHSSGALRNRLFLGLQEVANGSNVILGG